MNRLNLKQRVAIVTGGARGIGLAVAQRVLESGGVVSLWDIDSTELAAASDKLGRIGEVHTHTVNIAVDAEVNAATTATVKHFDKVDILVNNAGVTGRNAPTWELDPLEWRRVIDVNLIGAFLTTRAVVPLMLPRAYGRVINVASIAGKEGNPNASHYSASKAGLIGLTKSLGKELATSGILVNCVTPGAADTDLFSQMTPEHIAYMRSKIPLNRFADPREIAATICWLATEECSFATGAVFDISGGRATY